MKKWIGIIIFGLRLACTAGAEMAAGTELHFNFGEAKNGYATLGGAVWNSVAVGTFSAIQDARGVVQDGVRIHVALDAVTQGTNPKDLAGNGYISADLNRMSSTLIYALKGNQKITVTMAGLGAGTRWNLDVFAGLNVAARNQTIAINGGSATRYTCGKEAGGIFQSHAPISIGQVAADANGQLTLELTGAPPTHVSFIQGAILTAGSGPAAGPMPVSAPAANTVPDSAPAAGAMPGSGKVVPF
jgi:hypothetical protein